MLTTGGKARLVMMMLLVMLPAGRQVRQALLLKCTTEAHSKEGKCHSVPAGSSSPIHLAVNATPAAASSQQDMHKC